MTTNYHRPLGYQITSNMQVFRSIRKASHNRACVAMGLRAMSQADVRTTGKIYHDILYKSRGNNQIALRDFLHLLNNINSPNEGKFAILTAELYQYKHSDFSEQIASHFVDACIRSGHTAAAAEHLAKYDNRLGAWLSPSSMDRLIASLLDGDPAAAAPTDDAEDDFDSSADHDGGECPTSPLSAAVGLYTSAARRGLPLTRTEETLQRLCATVSAQESASASASGVSDDIEEGAEESSVGDASMDTHVDTLSYQLLALREAPLQPLCRQALESALATHGLC